MRHSIYFLWLFSYQKNIYFLYRVTVHNRGTFPLLDEHGLDIKPNTATNIAIERVSLAESRRIYPVQSKKVVIKREAAPYGSCMKDWSETGMNEELVKTTEGVRIPYAQGVKEANKLTHNYSAIITPLTADFV